MRINADKPSILDPRSSVFIGGQSALSHLLAIAAIFNPYNAQRGKKFRITRRAGQKKALRFLKPASAPTSGARRNSLHRPG